MARNDHSGYPLNWFKDQNVVRQFHECALCLEVLKDTVQVGGCGHQFCALCIDDVLKAGPDPECPTCRNKILDAKFFEDNASRRLIKQLDVNCCNEGCSWHGTLGSLLKDHQKKCDFSIQNFHESKVERLVEQHEKQVKELELLKLQQSENRVQQLEEKRRPTPPVMLRRSENPWQRPNEKEKELCGEEKKTAELYRTVMGILNKLTPRKFKRLVEQLMELSIDTAQRLEGVIEIIHEKAIREPLFCAAYANLCRCLFGIKVKDAEDKDVSFRKLLLNRCQRIFEREEEDEQTLLQKYGQLEELSEKEKKNKIEEVNEAQAKFKRQMFGNIKFIGELFKLKLLTENIMHDCIFKLLRAGDEESLESMCVLLYVAGKNLDTEKAKPRMDDYFKRIKKITSRKIIAARKMSSRVIFILRDVVELRENKWVLCREEHHISETIDQIHKEAQQSKVKEQRFEAKWSSRKEQQKKAEPPKKKSSEQRCKDVDKKVTAGSLRDAYKDKLPPQKTVVMPGQRPSYMPRGHSMSMAPRQMRSRPMYSQSPQGHSPMQGFIPQQNVQYQVVGQDPYGQPVMRHAYIPSVPQYQMQATSAPFQPQFMPQQAQYFNQGMPQAMYYMQPNQQIQQPQQQQQQPTQTKTQNTAIQTNNINKPKQKRSKIVIRDPSKDNKNVTEEILHSSTANGRTGSTPPLTNSTVQTDSSKIRAQFAAQRILQITRTQTKDRQR